MVKGVFFWPVETDAGTELWTLSWGTLTCCNFQFQNIGTFCLTGPCDLLTSALHTSHLQLISMEINRWFGVKGVFFGQLSRYRHGTPDAGPGNRDVYIHFGAIGHCQIFWNTVETLIFGSHIGTPSTALV